MKEFIVKHPVITFLLAALVCDTVYSCVKIVKNPTEVFEPIKITISSEGDMKGA